MKFGMLRHCRHGWQYLVAIGACGMLVPYSGTARADSVSQQTAVETPARAGPASQGLTARAGGTDEVAQTQLPLGHPPIDEPDTGTVADATAPPQQTSSGSLRPSRNIAPGTVEVHVINDKNEPAAGVSVILQTHRESVAEGNSDWQRGATADSAGIVRFSQLSSDSNLSYRLLLSHGGARYGMQPFQLPVGQGILANMRQFALVNDIGRALLASESMVFVEPKDDVLQFEIVYRLYNVGQTIWVSNDTEVELPRDKQAFSAQQASDDIRVESTARGVRLVGTVPPGQHEVSYTFQLARQNLPSMSIEVGLPPNALQARVGVAGNRNTELVVEGFPDAQPTTAQNGQRLFLTMQTFDRARLPESLKFELRGLPTLGSGRLVAAGCAAAIALLGLAFAISRHRRGLDLGDRYMLEERARNRLLEELIELENARAVGTIGPKTYEEIRSMLVEALIRLEPLTE